MTNLEEFEKKNKNWLFSDSGDDQEQDKGVDEFGEEKNNLEEDEFGAFMDNQFEDMENGEFMFKLQKSFQGDKRFILDKRYLFINTYKNFLNIKKEQIYR